MGKIRLSRPMALLLALALGCTGCSNGDSDRLARVARRVAAKNGTLTGTGGAWQHLPSMDELTVDGRVNARLRWDKALAGALIQVKFSDGSVELSGKVLDLEQHRRAVALVQSTVGVDETKIKDRLEESGKK
jgi:hypothetical protein